MSIRREHHTADALRRAVESARAKWSDVAPERVIGRTAGGWPITTNAVVATVAELPTGDVVGVAEPAAVEHHAIWNVIAARRVRAYPIDPAVPAAALRRAPPFASRPPGRGPPFDPALLVDSLPSGTVLGLSPAAGTRPAGAALILAGFVVPASALSDLIRPPPVRPGPVLLHVGPFRRAHSPEG